MTGFPQSRLETPHAPAPARASARDSSAWPRVRTVLRLGSGGRVLAAALLFGSAAALGAAPASAQTIPVVTVDDAGEREATLRDTMLLFNVMLSAPATADVTFDYAVAGTGMYPATAGDDYDAPTTTSGVVLAGESATTIPVRIRDDSAPENPETVRLTLSGLSSNAQFAGGAGTAEATGTIFNSIAIVTISEPAADEGMLGAGGTLDFLITLDHTSTSEIRLEYTTAVGTSPGEASAGDFSATTNAVVSILPGMTSATATVMITGDDTSEPDETLAVRFEVTGAGPAVFVLDHGVNSASSATRTGTIWNDDGGLPTVSVGNPADVDEPSGPGSDQSTGGTQRARASTSMEFPLSLSGPAAAPVTVEWRVLPPPASTAVGGSTNTDATMNDAPDGHDWYYRILGFGDANDASTLLPNGNLSSTFPAGSAIGPLQVVILGDEVNVDEPDETVVVEIVRVTGGADLDTASGADRGTGRILDSGPPLTLSIADAQDVTEGDTGSSTMTFTVMLSAPAPADVTFTYALGGTAASGDDYTAHTSFTGTIMDGMDSTTIVIEVLGDTLIEGNETVTVTLSNPSGGNALGTATATGNIIDDEDPRTLSIADAQDVTEGDTGSSTMTFMVMLSPPASGTNVTFNYTLAGSATPAVDYVAHVAPLTGTISNATGLTTIEIQVLGDTLGEGDETVTVTLSNPSPGTVLGTAMATGRIINDDAPPPTVSIGDAADVNEPSGPGQNDNTVMPTPRASTSMEFPLSLSGPPGADVTVEWRVLPPPASTAIGGSTDTHTNANDAPAGHDWYYRTDGDAQKTATVLPGGNVSSTISAGSTSSLLYLVILGDEVNVAEPTETVVVEIVSVTGDAMLDTAPGANRGTGRILDSGGPPAPPQPTLSIADAPAVTESDAGPVRMTFTVTRSEAASGGDVTFTYALGGTATAGTDYTEPSPLTGRIRDGSDSTTIVIQVRDDTEFESDETVTVTISNPSTGTVLGTAMATGVIHDDPNDAPPQPTLSIADAPDVTEGNSGMVDMTFTVTRSAAATGTVTFAYALGGTATAGDDYTEPSPLTGMIAVGMDSTMIVIKVRGDTAFEDDETVTVTLSNPSAGTVLEDEPEATGVITNDDDPPALSIMAASDEVPEPSSGATSTLAFTVSLPGPAGKDVTFTYEVTGGTAGVDYVAPRTRTVTIRAGQTSATVMIEVRNDGDDRVRDALGIRLAEATNAVLPPPDMRQDETRVQNTMPVVRIEDTSVAEGASGTRPMIVFTATLDRVATSPVRIEYTVLDTGTAEGGEDYVERPAGFFEIGTGSATATLAITLLGDDEVEPNETVVVEFTIATSGYLFEGEGANLTAERTGTIRNDDGDPDARTKGLTHVLSGVGRTLAGTVVDLVWDRAASHRSGASESHATVGGRPLDAGFAGGGEGGAALRAAGALAGLLGVDAGSSGRLLREAERRLASGGGLGALRDWADLPDGRELLGRSRFAVSLAGHEDGGSGGLFTFWGRGSVTSFESVLEDGSSSEGDVMAGHLGLDYRFRGDLLAGAALSLTGSSVDYAQGESTGEIDTELLSLHPYLHWVSPDGLGVWGAVGYGTGTAELDEKGEEPFETDLTMQMAAGGVRGEAATVGNIDLAVKADAFLVGIEADGAADANNNTRLKDVDAASSRARLALEGTSSKVLETGDVIAGRFELGARYDGGDAAEGAGADIAAGFDYEVPDLGLEVRGRGNLLLVHQEEDFSEWGLGLGVIWDPGASGKGVQFSVEPGWGVPVRDSAASPWDSGAGRAARRAASRASLDARLGYGLGILGGRGLATVFGELGGTGEDGRLRLGTELRRTGAGASGRLELYGERRDRPAGAEHSVILKGSLGF